MGETRQFPLDFTPQCPHLAWLSKHLDGWQFGEQGLIHAIVNAMGTQGAAFEEGIYIEFGAGDGQTLPLTIERIYEQFPGWCWLIEIDDERRNSLAQKYDKAVVRESLDWSRMHGRLVNLVVIDIDGRDSTVMQEMFNADVRPTLLVVEHMDRHYPITTSAPAVIPSWLLGHTLKTGHAIQDTAETLHAIAAANGYERIGYNRCNSFFVVKERYAELFR